MKMKSHYETYVTNADSAARKADAFRREQGTAAPEVLALRRQETRQRQQAIESIADLIGGTLAKGTSLGRFCKFGGIPPRRKSDIDDWNCFVTYGNAQQLALDHPNAIMYRKSRTEPLAVLSAPYRMPNRHIFPGLIGIVLNRSWYGYGTHGLVWVRHEHEERMRAFLEGL